MNLRYIKCVSLQTLNIRDAYADERFDRTVSNDN